MGEPIRWSLSVDEETVAIAERWKVKFAPFADTRSKLVRTLLKLWDRAATDEKLTPLLIALQGLKLNNLSQPELESPAHGESGAKSPVRVALKGSAAHRGREFVSRKMASEAYRAPFFFHFSTRRLA